MAGLAWRSTDPRAFASNIAPLLALAACGGSLGMAWLRHQDATQIADDLILAEQPVAGESAAGRAIAKRIHALEGRRSREHLAEQLRLQLRLAEEATESDMEGTRPRTISTLNRDQRRALIADRERVAWMAATLEVTEVDPRALILLARASDSSPMSAAHDPNSGATLARRLEQAWTLIAPLQGQDPVAGVSQEGERRGHRIGLADQL